MLNDIVPEMLRAGGLPKVRPHPCPSYIHARTLTPAIPLLRQVVTLNCLPMACAFLGNLTPAFDESSHVPVDYLWQCEEGDSEQEKIANLARKWKGKSWTEMHLAEGGAAWQPTFTNYATSTGPLLYNMMHPSGVKKSGGLDHEVTEAVRPSRC